MFSALNFLLEVNRTILFRPYHKMAIAFGFYPILYESHRLSRATREINTGDGLLLTRMMILWYEDIHAFDNYNTMKYVQRGWGLRTSSMLRAGYPTLHACRGVRYDLSMLKTSYHSPRIVIECLPTRSMFIKMHLPFHGMCMYMYIVFTVSQFHADVHSAYLVFQISYMYLFDTTSESMNISLSLQ